MDVIDVFSATSYVVWMTKPTYDPLFNVRLPPELLAMLDELRRVEPDIPTRSEMVRRLIRRSGEAQPKARPLGIGIRKKTT